MAKHKFSNKELAHAFFHQEDFGIDWGEGRSFSFRGNTLYSYSSVIGILIPERNIFLFRSGSRSRSTSKHQSYTGRAIPHNIKTYHWPDWYIETNRSCYGNGGSAFENDLSTKREYVQKALLHVKNDKSSLKTGIKYFGNPNMVLAYRTDVEQFCKDLECEELLSEYIPEFDKLIWTEEELQIQEVKTWAYNNGIKGSYETKLKVYNNPELAQEVIEKNRIAKEKLDATKEERRLKAIQKSIEEWYNGEKDFINFLSRNGNRWYGHYNNPVYLRIKPSDDKMVQTSKDVEIPLVECALLYRKFKQCVLTDTEWHQNGDKFRIGYYQVNKIYKDDNKWYLRSGCHNICQDQIEEFVDKFTDWNKDE